MAKQQHRAIQSQGKRTPSPARSAVNTGGTYGGVSNAKSGATGYAFQPRTEDGAIPVPPAEPKEFSNTPLTLGHILAGWKLMAGVLFALACGLWWLAHLSSKVDQHDDDIKEVKTTTEKLVNESASDSAVVKRLDSQVEKLEEKVFQQAVSNARK